MSVAAKPLKIPSSSPAKPSVTSATPTKETPHATATTSSLDTGNAQTSILAERTGTFYGQCSEICGVWHGFMPIAVEAVSVQDYLAWIDAA